MLMMEIVFVSVGQRRRLEDYRGEFDARQPSFEGSNKLAGI
jgi:hypothetical protein